jgi:hypothetical protein
MDELLKAQAKLVLETGLSSVYAAAREGLQVTRQLRAQAEPVLGILEGAQAEIERLASVQSQLDDSIALLEPYAQISEIATLLFLLNAMKPILVAMAAVETARIALSGFVIPDLGAVGAAALVLAAKEIESGLELALRSVSSILEES